MSLGTVSYDQHAILQGIQALHNKGYPFELDPTYGRGGFYRRGVPQPLYKFDLHPQRDDVVQADCRRLPFKSGELESIVFDPPFLHAPGKESVLGQRFGGYPSQRALGAMYQSAITEFARILRPGGLLVWKCQDTVESGRQVWNADRITAWAEQAGFTKIDQFILLKRSALRGWNWGRQQHAHRQHSYFLVFRYRLPARRAA